MTHAERIEKFWKEAFTPPPVLTVSEWADQHRILSKRSSSEPGKWDTSRTPYLKEIMDVLSISNPALRVVFMKASQVGGTECGNNWLGYIIDYAPGPAMLVQPSLDMAKRNAHLRIEPLIEECPRLKVKVASRKSKDATNTTLQKDFENGTLVMTGANSAAGLRSTPAKYLFLDEVDAYPRDVDGEGDPISLVMARSRTFGQRRKALIVSTPTIEGFSKIQDEFLDSDQRFFHVPCPECGKKQKLEFDKLQWPEGKPEGVLYYCAHCGVGIEENFKTVMLANGEWVKENPTSETPGFHLNSLYSPVGWFSWKEIAIEYDKAKKQMEKERKTELMRTFVNTIKGETYKEIGEAPEWRRIYERREHYQTGTVPSGVGFLTCGVDIQKDRIELEVVGWGRNKESFSVDYQVLAGDTSQDDVWDQLQSYLGKTFPHAEGFDLPIRLTSVDSGFNTQKVYNFCRRFPSRTVLAVKGVDHLSAMIGPPRAVDVKERSGKMHRRGVKVWNVGSSVIKTELYGFLKADKPIGDEKTPVGYCHFPEYDAEYFQQLTAEKVIVRRNRRGYAVIEWVKERERNEALDCRVYARAAAAIVGVDRFKESDWAKFRGVQPVAIIDSSDNNKKEGDEATKETEEPKRSPKPKKEKRSRSDYWG